MNKRVATIRAWTGVFALLFFVGCAGDEPIVPEDPEARAVREAAEREAAMREEARGVVMEHFEEAFREWVQDRLGVHPLEKLLTMRDPPIRLQRKLFLATLYEGRDWEPLLVRNGELTSLGFAVIERLQDAPRHALDSARYWNDDHRLALDLMEEWAWAWQHRPTLTLSRQERKVIADLVDQIPAGTPRDMKLAILDLALDVEDVESAPIPDLARLWKTRVELERGLRAHEAVFEARLMDSLFVYAFDQRHGNVAMFGSGVSEDERLRIVAGRFQTLFGEMVEAHTSGDIEAARAVMNTLEPPHPQYALLLAERARYLEIVESGGWPRVASFAAQPGQSHPRIPQLRERLRIEGYLPPLAEGETDSQRYDADLEQAIRDYQETHQIDVTGRFYPLFWTSLNVPAASRLEQIELTLQRWRESRIGDDTYYVFVNIPDFHGEVWRDGNRDMRFRVVVGNNRRVCNPRTRTLELPDATPLQSFRMTYMVLNPFWNVPRRLVRDQLLPQLLEDPEFFDRMGYERFTTEAGVEIVRQRPGPQNALGAVKFMFPNQHNVYMHDTPQRGFFNHAIRAFSSGCVRVQDPLDFMQYLLEQDGQWDPARIDRMFEAGEEISIVLRQSVPVHFEYYVVRVDDQGRANFLSDIYRYDRNRLNTPDPEALACDPPEQPEMALTLGEDGRVMMRDADGVLHDPEELRRLREAEIVDGEGPPAGDMGP